MDQPQPSTTTEQPRQSYLGLGLIAMLILLPVTLPVPVLRSLVHDRFAVSEFQTSLFMSINMIGAFLAAPIAGTLADRFGNHFRTIIIALLLDAACFFAMTADMPFALFMTIRFVEGCAHIFALSLLLAITADSATEGDRGRAMGLVGAGLTFGVAIGAPVGGQLAKLGTLIPIYSGGIVVCLAAILTIFLLPRTQGKSNRPGLRGILSAVQKDRAMLVPLAYAFVDRFTVGFFTTTFVLSMKRLHDLQPANIGLLLGLFLLPFSVLSYPFGRLSQRYSRTWMLAGGSALYGIGLITLGTWPPAFLPYGMLLLGTLSAVMFVPSLVMITELASPAIRSVAMGGFNAAGSLGFVLGPIVGGWVSQSVAAEWGWPAGYRAAFAVAGAAEILCVILTLPLLLRLIRSGRTT